MVIKFVPYFFLLVIESGRPDDPIMVPKTRLLHPQFFLCFAQQRIIPHLVQGTISNGETRQRERALDVLRPGMHSEPALHESHVMRRVNGNHIHDTRAESLHSYWSVAKRNNLNQ